MLSPVEQRQDLPASKSFLNIDHLSRSRTGSVTEVQCRVHPTEHRSVSSIGNIDFDHGRCSASKLRSNADAVRRRLWSSSIRCCSLSSHHIIQAESRILECRDSAGISRSSSQSNKETEEDPWLLQRSCPFSETEWHDTATGRSVQVADTASEYDPASARLARALEVDAGYLRTYRMGACSCRRAQ